MDREFWLAKWKAQTLGFHLDGVNPNLVEFAGRLPEGGRVLVPLCGKSVDMAWLVEHGHRVLGVELSPIAAHAFFDERGQSSAVRIDELGPFKRLSTGGVEILQGDLFDLGADLVGTIDAVYDRAALIALPPPMRERYVPLLSALLPAGAPYLLITLEVDGREGGPPFSLGPRDVQRLFAADFEIETLGRRLIEGDDSFAGSHEGRYLLTRRA